MFPTKDTTAMNIHNHIILFIYFLILLQVVLNFAKGNSCINKTGAIFSISTPISYTEYIFFVFIYIEELGIS